MSILDEFKLSGMNALVTGGAGDLGSAITQALVEAGASAIIVDANEAAFSIATDFRTQGYSVSALECDVRDRQQIREAFDSALHLSDGSLDILVNCAGIQRRCASEDFTEQDWDDVLNVNLDATFFFCQLAGRNMIERGRGKIINISSVMSFFGGLTIPAYAASKGGVSQLTKALSNDWAPKGICVNAIAPGFMEGRLTKNFTPDSARHVEISTRIPKGRWGQGRDLAGLVVFLASAASDYLTGTVIPVDGGYSSR